MRHEHDVLRRVMMRLVKSKMAAAFSTWRGIAAELKQEEHKLHGAVTRLMNRHLSMAFEKWQATAAQMQHEQMAMNRAMMRLVHSKLAVAMHDDMEGSLSSALAQEKFGLHGGLGGSEAALSAASYAKCKAAPRASSS